MKSVENQEASSVTLPVEQPIQFYFHIPPIIESITEITLGGQVIVPQYLRYLTISIGNSTILQISREESDAITEHIWEVNWTPIEDGHNMLTVSVTDWVGNTRTEILPMPFEIENDEDTIFTNCNSSNLCLLNPSNGSQEGEDLTLLALLDEDSILFRFEDPPALLNSLSEITVRGQVIVPEYLHELTIQIGDTTISTNFSGRI